MSIKLERFTSEEIPLLVSWIPDKEFLMQWGGPSYIIELLEEQLQSDINKMLQEDSKSMMFSAKLTESNETVGHIQLNRIDKVNMSARIGKVLVGTTEYRNRGIGLQMVNAVLDIAFNELKLHRVDLGVFDFNVSAITCYKKAGFLIEGNLRDSRRINGEYWSLLNMSILEDEYRRLRG